MKNKLPAFQFYTGDWLKDPALSMCSPATRGVWIDLLCVLHELARTGQVTGTPEQLCRTCRCTAAEFVAAITEIQTTGTADVHERNGELTIVNRRMQREHLERLATAERVAKYRCNADVTRKKRESNAGHVTSSSSSEESKDSSKKDMSGLVVREVFAYWQTRLNHPTAKLTGERRGRIDARLEEGYTPEQIKQAVDGCGLSPYHQGLNDLATVYDDIELICRSGSKLENFIRLAEQRSNSNGDGSIARVPTGVAGHRETHNERAARETLELVGAALASTGCDPDVDPEGSG